MCSRSSYPFYKVSCYIELLLYHVTIVANGHELLDEILTYGRMAYVVRTAGRSIIQLGRSIDYILRDIKKNKERRPFYDENN